MKKTSLLIGIILLFFSIISCKNESKKGSDEPVITEQKEEILTKTPPKIEENLSGELIILSEEEFEATITDMDNPKGYQYKGYTPCIIDFYADWCGPCHAVTPALVELAKEYQGKVIFYKVNVDKSPNAANVFKIMNLPTFIFLKPNMQPVKVEGAHPKEDLKFIIDDVFFKPQNTENS